MNDSHLFVAFIVAMVLGGVGVLIWGEWWLDRKAAEDRAAIARAKGPAA